MISDHLRSFFILMIIYTEVHFFFKTFTKDLLSRAKSAPDFRS